MRIITGLFLISALLPGGATAGSRTLFTLPWGTGEGAIGYYNSTSQGFDQPYAEGPGGIATGPEGEIWISDTFNHRLLRFDRTGKGSGALGDIHGRALKQPMALRVEGQAFLAVVEAEDALVLRADRGQKKLDVLGDQPTEAPARPLVQPALLALTPQGDLWVGDAMRSRLVHYHPSGRLLEEIPWQLSGLYLEPDGTLFTLEERMLEGGKSETYLGSRSPAGEAADRFPLVAPELRSPFLVGLDAEGRAYVRFVTPGPQPRHLLVRYDADGSRGLPLGEVPPTITTQQYTLTPDGTLLALSFDAGAAPQGTISVLELGP